MYRSVDEVYALVEDACFQARSQRGSTQMSAFFEICSYNSESLNFSSRCYICQSYHLEVAHSVFLSLSFSLSVYYYYLLLFP